MNRRDFLKGGAAVVGASAVPLSAASKSRYEFLKLDDGSVVQLDTYADLDAQFDGDILGQVYRGIDRSTYHWWKHR